MPTSSQLAPHEKLLVDRRRKGLTQTQAAKAWGVTEWQYRMMESGNRKLYVPTKLGKLQPYESAFIMRRRKQLKRTQVAEMIGVSAWWLTQMEHGAVNPQRLIDFWS